METVQYMRASCILDSTMNPSTLVLINRTCNQNSTCWQVIAIQFTVRSPSCLETSKRDSRPLPSELRRHILEAAGDVTPSPKATRRHYPPNLLFKLWRHVLQAAGDVIPLDSAIHDQYLSSFAIPIKKRTGDVAPSMV